jgi:hypothetical protein
MKTEENIQVQEQKPEALLSQKYVHLSTRIDKKKYFP